MTIIDVLFQKKVVGSITDAKQLIFNRKISINGMPCNSIHQKCEAHNIVRIGKIEILITKP